jgi:hypothetical protein
LKVGFTSNNQVNPTYLSRDKLYYAIIAILTISLVALAAFVVGGYGNQTVYVTKNTYLTTTQTVNVVSTATIVNTQFYVTTSSATPPPPSPNGYPHLNMNNCYYPLNPFICNEGPPATIIGYLTQSGSCSFLSSGGATYVVWNLPNSTYAVGIYSVFGYVYPDWPSNVPFPPYPFQQNTCIGIPMWAVYPFIKSGV